MKDKILVFVAHSDDETLGMGGTIAKFSKEGKEVITIIVSNGGGSSPWLNKDMIVNERMKEAKAIGEFLGTAETIFLGYDDGKLSKELENKKAREEIKNLIQKYKPEKIFTHSYYDKHISLDHQAVNKAVLEVLEEIDPENKIILYGFEVWNVVEEKHPRIYIDVSKTFKKKLQALKKFKSQKIYIYALLIPVVYRAIISGIMNKCRYAERFYKLR